MQDNTTPQGRGNSTVGGEPQTTTARQLWSAFQQAFTGISPAPQGGGNPAAQEEDTTASPPSVSWAQGTQTRSSLRRRQGATESAQPTRQWLRPLGKPPLQVNNPPRDPSPAREESPQGRGNQHIPEPSLQSGSRAVPRHVGAEGVSRDTFSDTSPQGEGFDSWTPLTAPEVTPPPSRSPSRPSSRGSFEVVDPPTVEEPQAALGPIGSPIEEVAGVSPPQAQPNPSSPAQGKPFGTPLKEEASAQPSGSHSVEHTTPSSGTHQEELHIEELIAPVVSTMSFPYIA